MDKNWVKIFTTGEPYKAELFKGLLEKNEIMTIVLNKKDSAYLFGDIELYVHADDVLKAKQIITIHNSL